jgi:hypothetical protein
VSIDIADVDLGSSAHFHWVCSRRLRNRVRFFEPVAWVDVSLPIRTWGLYPSQIWCISENRNGNYTVQVSATPKNNKS